MWGSRTCSSRERDLADVIHQLGLHVLNTGVFTFIRRTGRLSCTAIDISLASEGARYDCTTEADTWGSDNLPIVSTPVGGRIPRTRRLSATRESSQTQSWQGICDSLSQARGGSKAWRLLRSLVIGTAVRQPVLAVAIRLGITEQELAERLADRFTAL
ncbi:hypothetical protein MTO96_045712, partial [Rhipicephalus appendiculatus]